MIIALTILNVFIAAVAVFLGLFLLFAQGRNRQRSLFALLNITAAVWVLSNYLGSNMINIFTRPLIFSDYISGAFLGLLFLLFCKEIRKSTGQGHFTAMGTTAVVATVATVATVGLILSGLVVDITVDSVLKITNGPVYLLYPLILFAFVSIGISHLVRAQLKTRSVLSRTRLRLILIGLSVAFVFIAVPNLIFENIFPKGSQFLIISYNSSYAGILAFLVLSTYAIVKHGLFDIKLAAVRSAAYVLVLLSLSGIYYVLAYLISLVLFKGETSSLISTSPINIALALVLAFLFQPVKRFFDRITDKFFFHERYHAEEFYARLSEVLTTTTDLRSLLQRTSKEIGETMKAEHAFFFVQYNHIHHVSAGTQEHRGLPMHDIHLLNNYVTEVGGDVIVTELLQKHDAIRRLLISHKIAVVMPLMRDTKILGYLALGDHQGGGYTNRDVRVLNTVSDELVIAIQNALSVQQIKDINEHLQQRINEATQELRSSNARLRRIDTTKDEFLSMASHQLRTPLTSIKGYLSMVLEGDAGKITSMQKHLLSEAFNGSERMVHLIHDFLNVSRIQTGKFTIEKKEIDLVNLVRDEVESLVSVAQVRGLKLKTELPKQPIMLDLDESKMRQVVMNFIDNAIYYSRPDTTILITLEQGRSSVKVKVVDQGIGVPVAQQEKLFTKFFRADNARKQRPDGTGVGLYLAKKVIDGHDGKLIFSSKENEGSTFGFELPLKYLAHKHTDKADDDKRQDD